MGRGDEVDVRPLCVRRDLGDMGVVWGYINVTVSDVEMLHMSKGVCWMSSEIHLRRSTRGFLQSGLCHYPT